MLYLELCKLLKMLILVNDESELFTHTLTEDGRTHTTLARNVIMFGVDMSFSKHANNQAHNI